MDALCLFQRYRDDVYRLAVNYTGSPREAEAVSRAVFLSAAEKAPAPGDAQDFLMQQTARRCRHLVRLRRWKRLLSPPAPAAELPEDWQAVMRLSPECRAVMYLRYYEDCTTDEIARLLGISQSAAAARLTRGRALLEKQREQHGSASD